MQITPDKLAAAIAESNKTRALIRELYDLRKGDEVYIDGTEMAQILAVNTNYATMISGPTSHLTKLKFIQLSKVEEKKYK